jgi:DNA-directed RNA polymerase subunit M/transcription elongation factor TFIIS
MASKTTLRGLTGRVSVVRKRPTGAVQINIPVVKPTEVKTLSDYIPELTAEQKTEIDKINIGTSEDPDYNEAVITIVNTIKTLGYDKTINYMKSVKGGPREFIFNTPLNSQLEETYNINLDALKEKEKGVTGVFHCPRCGSDKSRSARKQTRSADEPETIFVTCLACYMKYFG